LTGYVMYATLRPMSLDFLTDVEFDVPTETRIKQGLAKPVERSTTGGMQLGAINKVSQARIRYALAELTGMQLDKVSAWFDALALDSPAKALELLIEILKFTTPQQKQVSVENVPTDHTNYGNLTMKQLQGLVFPQPTDAPVSEQ
jgi:hypothetical protein